MEVQDVGKSIRTRTRWGQSAAAKGNESTHIKAHDNRSWAEIINNCPEEIASPECNQMRDRINETPVPRPGVYLEVTVFATLTPRARFVCRARVCPSRRSWVLDAFPQPSERPFRIDLALNLSTAPRRSHLPSCRNAGRPFQTTLLKWG